MELETTEYEGGKQMILGIVGSPRKGGLTDQLVTRALGGASSAGLETKKVHLADFEVPFIPKRPNVPKSSAECVKKPMPWS